MCELDLEACDVWIETERTARKEHHCSACHARIALRERYTTHFSKADGVMFSEKLCNACRDARGEFADAHDGMLVSPSYFSTVLDECIADGDDESERRWKPMLAALRARNGVSPERSGGQS